MRYLDSRDDEQARGITMKSSSISLLYVPGAAHKPEGTRGLPEEEKAAQGKIVLTYWHHAVLCGAESALHSCIAVLTR